MFMRDRNHREVLIDRSLSLPSSRCRFLVGDVARIVSNDGAEDTELDGVRLVGVGSPPRPTGGVPVAEVKNSSHEALSLLPPPVPLLLPTEPWAIKRTGGRQEAVKPRVRIRHKTHGGDAPSD